MIKPLCHYPRETWKKYKVYYSVYGFNYGSYCIIEAPNKTYARLIKQGELNAEYKIIKIIEA